ncbi:MAG: alpha/beta fold hydrolase [Polyangiales bacterium]
MSATNLSYELHGAGPDVVFLHSFPLDRSMWKGQLVAAGAAGRRAVLVDLPGFGASPLPAGAAPSLDAMAHAVLDTLDAVGAARATLVGLSLGGYVALAVAALAPERVEALVLADTRAASDDPATRAGRMLNLALVRDRGAGALVDKMLPKLLAPDAPEALRAEVRALGAAQSREAVTFALLAMRDRPDRGDVAAALDVPALVLAGSRDEITPPKEMRALAASMRRARFEELEGAGHLSSLERPAAFNAALEGFLRGGR